MSDDRHQTRSQASPHTPLLTGVGIIVGAVSHGMLNVVRRKPVLFGKSSGLARLYFCRGDRVLLLR